MHTTLISSSQVQDHTALSILRVQLYMTMQYYAKDILSTEQAKVLYCDKVPMCSGQANVCPASSNRIYGKFPEMMTARHEQRITMHSRINVRVAINLHHLCISCAYPWFPLVIFAGRLLIWL